MKAIAEITVDALNLPPFQRLQLARILMEMTSADNEVSPDAEAAWENEIMARLHAVQSGTARSRPATEIFAELDQRFPT